MNARSGWIPQLDGLRGVAALAVVVAHWNGSPYASQPFGGLVDTLHAWNVALGAVSLFFALSAFLLTYLAVLEYDRTGAVDTGAFYRRRMLRIWPLYLTIVALNLAAPAPWGPWMRDHWWLYVGFLSNWSLALNDLGGHVDTTSPLLVILWSIAVEEQFYAVFPLAMRWLLPRARLAPLVVLGLIGTAVLWRYAFLLLVPDGGSGNAARLYYASPTYLDTFALGAAGGWLCARRPRWYCFVLRGLGLPGAWIPIVAALVWLLGHWGGVEAIARDHWIAALYGLLATVLVLLIVWTVEYPDTPVSCVLASTPLRWLGLVSFGLYVWHPFAEALVWQRGTDDGGVMFVAYLLLTVAMAALGYRLIERPFLLLKRRTPSHHATPITVQV